MVTIRNNSMGKSTVEVMPVKGAGEFLAVSPFPERMLIEYVQAASASASSGVTRSWLIR